MAYDISVGVSIDGPRCMSRNRVGWRGLPMFDRIMTGIEKLRSYGVSFTIIAVVDRENTLHAREILSFLAELKCSFVGFNMEEKEGANTYSRTPTIEQARHFWRDVFSWSRSNPEMRVREVDRLLEFLSDAGGSQRRRKARPHPHYRMECRCCSPLSRATGDPRSSLWRFYRWQRADRSPGYDPAPRTRTFVCA
jgi:sulfatase maturation enzyme AslB (radical SAM superfamily)